MTKQVCCFGEIVWDVFPNQLVLGGAPLNVARHLLRQEMEVILLSAIGKDALGVRAFQILKEEGLDKHLFLNEVNPTGTVQILPMGADHHFEIESGCAWEEIPPCDHDLLEARRTQAVVFGSLALHSPSNQITFQELYQQHQNRIPYWVCDLNLRYPFHQANVIEKCLNWSTHLKINEVESRFLCLQYGVKNHDALANYLKSEFGIQGILLTLGEKGMAYKGEEGIFETLPTKPRKFEDAVGAGDSVTARFVRGLIGKEDLKEVFEEASKIAAEVIATKGAFPDPYPRF